MGELTRFIEDDESSEEEDKKPSQGRWVRPPLVPRSLDLHEGPQVSARAEAPEAPPAPKVPLFEQVLTDKPETRETSEEDDDDDEEEDDEKSSETVQAEENTEEDAAVEQAGQPASAEFAEIMKDMGSEFEAATSGEQLEEPAEVEPEEDEGILHVSHAEPGELPESVPQPMEEYVDEPPVPPTTAGGGGGQPPTRPPYPTYPGPSPDRGPGFYPAPAEAAPDQNAEQAATYRYNVISQQQPEYTQVEMRKAKEDSERTGFRRGLVAGFITGYVLKAYLAGRKRERYEKATEKQLEAQDERFAHLQAEQQRTKTELADRLDRYKREQEQVARDNAARYERPAPKSAPEVVPGENKEEIFDREGNRIELQPGWRVERSAGGYSVVLDERNRVVHDAIRYGEAFQRDQKREQLSDDMFAALDSVAAAHAAANTAAQAQQQASAPQTTYTPGMSPTGRVHEVDLQHRLEKPRSPLVATISSPWLWTAIAFLIIIYFIAALA
ncbi:MAG TPA: hypothetical protein VL737_02255 [Candidatus Pristimantibacillus sp.]|nr:hypothetical protein [Candidatus Pristimantibacillus sp.]